MADADRADHGLSAVDLLGEDRQSALGFFDIDAVRRHYGDPGGVITAVFQLAKTV